jgi:hypothetical protein
VDQTDIKCLYGLEENGDLDLYTNLK